MSSEHLLEEMDDLIYVSDPITYEVYYLNPSCEKVLKENADLTEPCYKLFQGLDHPCEFCTNALLSADSFYTWEHENERYRRHYLIRDKLINWDGKVARMEIATDITEQQNYARAVSEKLRAEQTLLACIRSLTETQSLGDGIRAVLRDAAEFFRADRAYILEKDNETDCYSATYEWWADETESLKDQFQQIPIAKLGYWEGLSASKQPFRLKNIETIRESEPEVYALMQRFGISALDLVPFSIGSEYTGCFGVANPAIQPHDLSFLNTLSFFVTNKIMERRRREEQEQRSLRDPLTGVYNRYRYTDYIVNLNGESLSSLGVAFIDINGLKELNDSHGHHYGDSVLTALAANLKICFDPKDIYRLSGDEFIVFCENAGYAEFIDRITRLRGRYDRGNYAAIAVGSTWQDENIDVRLLVRHAEELMYVDKQDYQRLGQTSRPVEALLEALRAGWFEVYLQPKADAATGRIVGSEALARLNHPQYGRVSPDSFIPTLEKERSIRYLDFYVFEEVCRLLSKWRAAGCALLPVSVNFSRITLLERGLADRLAEIQERFAIPRALLEIEVTESIGEIEREVIVKIGEELSFFGFPLALDDFGAKYTNMSLLTSMTVDQLKLDRSLINNLVNNSKNQLVVRHIIEICRGLNTEVIAEGVETAQQLDVLKHLGCHTVQGYYFGRPMPTDEFQKKYLLLK